MILYHGEVIDSSKQGEILNTLYDDCLKTLNKPNPLTIKKVINACDALYKKVIAGEYDDIALPLLKMADVSYERFLEMAKLFSKEGLEYKCRIELGEDYDHLKPLEKSIRKRLPLGILFHISAGNVDGLPAYSVVEGLLAGNINILKLPTGDNGLSIKLLLELIKVEPELKDYIYVFDVPSTEVETLKVFAKISDAIVVWGGDMAVQAAKDLSDVTTKIIAWGHKLSFAYATKKASDEDLKALADHICFTNQVLCSSCQGIFLDTDSDEECLEFAKRFFEIFKASNIENGKADLGMRGKNTINLYVEKMENKNQIILQDDGISIILKQDSELELSYLFRNIWIKKLPHHKIINQLKKHKNHLQTCGLLCSNDEREYLANILTNLGVVRITKGDLSRMFLGEAHDGTYALKEYTKIVEIDY